MTTKTELRTSAAMPHWQDTRFGAPGMLRGVTIPRAPEGDGGQGGGGDDGDGGDETPPVDPVKYAALVRNHERLKADDTRRKAELAEMKERLDALDAEKAAAEADAVNKSGDIEKIRKQLEDKHGKELAAANTRADKAEARVRALVIDSSLAAALDSVNVKPDLKRAVSALLKAEGIDIEDDADGNPAPVKDGIPLADAIKLWAETDDGKIYVLDGNAGGGALGGGKPTANNPWKKETWSVSKQDAIEAQDPAKAGRLKAEAGVK